MLGANLTELDEPTLALLTNDEVLAVNQDSLGAMAKRVFQRNQTELWIKNLNNGAKAIGFFNRGNAAADVELLASEVGISGSQEVRDRWAHENPGWFNNKLTISLPSHRMVQCFYA